MDKIALITNHPYAADSWDAIVPKGAKHDNTKSDGFINEIFDRYGKDLKYLDLGCAGGGFVAQVADKEAFSIGIDGSDYNMLNGTGEWRNDKVRDRFFTADITKPFYIVKDVEGSYPSRIKFDVISAFDVLEHINYYEIPAVIANIKNHLNPNGIFVTSIATFADEDYHVTIKPEGWWDSMFFEQDMIPDEPLKVFGRSSSINRVYKCHTPSL